MKQLNRKKIRFSRFDKILVIQPIAEMYGESNERQLCWEIGILYRILKIPNIPRRDPILRIVLPCNRAALKCKFKRLIRSLIGPSTNKPLVLHICSTSLLKTLWEKEKLLVTKFVLWEGIPYFIMHHTFSTFNKP